MENRKLKIIREKMQFLGLSALIIPTSDPHKSEYIPDFWKIRAWITGFKGSAGTAVITQNHAGLWTDSRYFLMAESQLEPPFQLHKLKTRTPEYIQWLNQELHDGEIIGIDCQLFSVNEMEHITNELAKKNISLNFIGDIFHQIWTDRPPMPDSKAILHPMEFAVVSSLNKIEFVRNYLTETNSTHIFLSSLDEIAWLLNIRGNDIEYNPLLLAYCLLTCSETFLFIDPSKIVEEVFNELLLQGIQIKPYPSVQEYLKTLKPTDVLLIDKNSLNYHLYMQIPKDSTIMQDNGFVNKLKAIKNKGQIQLYKEAQVADGVAMCKFLFWLSKEIKLREISEYEAGNKATYFRSKQPNFMGISFEPISAYQENAASPHYSASKANACFLQNNGIYLIDSGGQYLGGTTDITRTVSLGEISPEQIVDFTLVLKGHIRLATVKFPKGTKGLHLDTLTRIDLWQNGKNFDHGSGHGIGYFLNVHEGPQGFSQAIQGTSTIPFEPGMLVTNEPGYYLEGKYGIRIENVMVCNPCQFLENADFMEFETVSFCPIDKSLINVQMLNEIEIDWLNNYHQSVFQKISPFLNDEEREWLILQTSALV